MEGVEVLCICKIGLAREGIEEGEGGSLLLREFKCMGLVSMGGIGQFSTDVAADSGSGGHLAADKHFRPAGNLGYIARIGAVGV